MKIFVKKNYYEDNEYESYTHKKCQKCNDVKQVEAFGKNKTNSVLGWGWRSKCRECDRQLCSEYARNNREKRNKRLRDYRKKHPEKAKKYDLRGRLKKEYGITPEQRNEMFKSQNNKCYICGEKTTKLVIDHCHKTGKVRKLLCHGCNTMLGKFEIYQDRVEMFKKYLDEH